MKKLYLKRIIASVLVLSCLSLTTVYADVTGDLEDAREQVDNLQEQVDKAEEELDKINDKKDKLETDLKGLNTNLQNLVEEMNELEVEITAKQAEITMTTEDLVEAEGRCDKQYEDMKIRIQYMYENGSASVMEMFLEADSMSGFLNQAEYVASINNADRDKLKEFQELQAEIEEKKAILEQEETELLDLQDKMVAKRAEVNKAIAAMEDNISQTKTEIASAEETKKDLEEQLKKWEEVERELERQKIAEDLANWDSIANMDRTDWSGVPYVPAEGEAYLLAAIIQCESDGEPYEGKLAVGSVVLNRVRSSAFKQNTITDVVYAPKQFAPVASGRLAYRLQAGVNDTCKRAALEVLNGNITTNALFFRTVSSASQAILEKGTIIQNHVFY